MDNIMRNQEIIIHMEEISQIILKSTLIKARTLPSKLWKMIP